MYQFITISIDLKICTMSKALKSKDDLEMLHSEYLWENNGTTCHYGHPADCQLELTNVVEVQMKVVTND